MKRTKTFMRNSLCAGVVVASFIVLALLANATTTFAQQQATFVGDYDRAFAAPNGYYVEPQNNDPTIPSNPACSSSLFTGDLNPDGSILAGGRILRGDAGDFWLRKFTASGAVDASFGGGAGYVRTTFFTNTSGYNNVIPQVLKRQPDGKILFAGHCDGLTSSGNQNNAFFGSDICVVRYNTDGTLDATFGNNAVRVGFGPGCTSTDPNNPCTYTFQPGAGKFTTQSGQIECNGNCGNVIYAGTNGTIYDIALQADGKIILAGETRDALLNTTRYVGILIRLNPNGSLDASFGSGGIARLAGPNVPGGQYPNSYGSVRFNKVLVQPDGRIVAAGYDGTVETYFTGTVFLVTRWTANGVLETKRRLDNNASQTAREAATGLLFSTDGTKLFVSGSYQSAETLVRLNLSDLSVDSTFGTNGVQRYFYYSDGNGLNRTLNIKAIQPDGKILATDDAFVNDSHVIRFNPDGSPDQSFGNVGFNSTNQQPVTPRGRLALSVQTYEGNNTFGAGHILLRPNGRINLIGSVGTGFEISRGVVSQQNTFVSLLQFSAAAYSAQKDAGSATITVTRTGDTSSAASIDYATSDGTATQSRDYITSTGTLNFAAGETTKTFTVLLTNNAYANGNHTVNLTLGNPNPTGATNGAQTTAVLTVVNTTTTQPTTNPIDDARFFVRQQYLDFLNREPDTGGFDYWTSLITKCAATDQKCINSQRVSVSAAFFIEQEFQDTGSFVYRFYKGSLARQPNYAEFTQDRGRVIGGSNLEASKVAFANNWVQRPEFIARYPLSLQPGEFVDTLIAAVKTTTGNKVDLSSRRDSYLSTLQTSGRGSTVRQVVEESAFKTAEYNNAFVLMQYFGYLRRDPDTAGYNFWLDVLNNRVANNYRSMVCAFITSAEYQLRFSSVVTRNDQICGSIGQ